MEDCVYPGGLLQLISPTPHIPWVQICKNYHQILMTHLSCSIERAGDKGYTAREKHVGDKTPENSGDLLLTSRH